MIVTNRKMTFKEEGQLTVADLREIVRQLDGAGSCDWFLVEVVKVLAGAKEGFEVRITEPVEVTA
jgi:hypothetical protein